jgi:Protein of unknown function (DUF4238)
MTTDKVRHHFVPRGLIRHFTGVNDRIAIYDAVADQVFWSNPRDAFVKRDYHSTFTWDGPEDRNTLENLIMNVENFGLEALSTLVEERRFDEEIRAGVAALWSLQLVRTPPAREAAETVMKGQLRNVIRVLEKRRMLGEIPQALKRFGDTLSELVENEAVKINLLPQISLMSLAAFDTILDVLLDMRWSIFISSDHYLCLTDNPYAIYDPAYGYTGVMNLLRSRTESSFPVAKSVCLIATRYLPDGIFMESRRAVVCEINRCTAIFGQRFFGFPIIEEGMIAFFRKYAVWYPVVAIEEIESENDEGLKVSTILNRGFSSDRVKGLYTGNCKPLSRLVG